MTFLDIYGKRFKLQQGLIYIVGRGTNCDIMLDNESVDEKHAILFYENNVMHVLDLETRLGTYIDGERIKQNVIPSLRTLLGFGELSGLLTIYPKGHRGQGQ